MENCDSFEEKDKEYKALPLKVALQKVSEGTLSVYAASKRYEIPEQTIS